MSFDQSTSSCSKYDSSSYGTCSSSKDDNSFSSTDCFSSKSDTSKCESSYDCSKCSSDSGSCISSSTFDLCDTSSGDSSNSSSLCDTSCSCTESGSYSESKDDNTLIYDLATAAMTFVPTQKAIDCADFVGSKVVARGYIYKGCTICKCKCDPFVGCGIFCGKPQYPKKVVGTYDLEYTIVNPEFNRALANLFMGYFCKYFELSKRLSGRVLANGVLTLSFSDSDDFFLPSVDTLVLSGLIPWGSKGEEWSMAVTGGTGDYQYAAGQGNFERLCLTNGSRTRMGESWRLCLNPDDLLNKPVCK